MMEFSLPRLPRRPSRASFVVRAAGAFAAGLVCVPVAAQQVIESDDSWKFEITPYVWLGGPKSELRLGSLPTDAARVSSSPLQALDFAAMGTLEARKGQWGGLLDAMYLDVGASGPLGGRAIGSYNLDLVQQTYTIAGYYRSSIAPRVTIDLLGGSRYSHIDTTFDVHAGVPGMTRTFEGQVGWWNAIVGVRMLASLSDRWQLMAYVDGGEGSSSRTWQAIAGVSYLYSPDIALKFGYRYLDLQRKCACDGLLKSLGVEGFYLGAGFKF